MVTEDEIQQQIELRQRDETNDEQLVELIDELIGWVWSLPNYRFDHDNPESVMIEASELCLQKVARYDASKGKASNFFITIIGCYLRQVRRSQMNKKLKRNKTGCLHGVA
jgi:hypothetical protein